MTPLVWIMLIFGVVVVLVARGFDLRLRVGNLTGSADAYGHLDLPDGTRIDGRVHSRDTRRT